MRWLGIATLVLALGALASTPTAGAEGERVIVALGDSLTAGYGVAPHEAYPARLEARLRREGYAYRVVNAGVTGDTSAGGLRRVDWALRAAPTVVIVAFGGNDGLRGLSPRLLAQNLEQIVTRLTRAGARVLLTGMRVPPNYGDEFARDFAAAYTDVARRTRVAFMPFLLDGVAGHPDLNQADGIHPNYAGHQVIADHLWPYLKPLLDR